MWFLLTGAGCRREKVDSRRTELFEAVFSRCWWCWRTGVWTAWKSGLFLLPINIWSF